MNSNTLKGLISLVLIVLSSAAYAQEDTLLHNHQMQSDSLVVITPTRMEADINMITAPAGFEVSKSFNGYIHFQNGCAIYMTMIENANYLRLNEGMTEDFYTKNKLTKISETEFVSDNGVKGIYYKCKFTLDEMDFTRYIVYAGDLNNTLWLNVTYPVLVEGLMEDEILKTIQTINLNPVADEE